MATMVRGIITTKAILLVGFLCISLFSKINEVCLLDVEARENFDQNLIIHTSTTIMNEFSKQNKYDESTYFDRNNTYF
jgi:hypothetical protein